MVSRILSEGMPFGGTWTYDVTPSTRGTVVTITENGEVYHPVFRFVSRFIMGHHGTATTFLQDLGRKFEEEVPVETTRRAPKERAKS